LHIIVKDETSAVTGRGRSELFSGPAPYGDRAGECGGETNEDNLAKGHRIAHVARALGPGVVIWDEPTSIAVVQ
jgi:hypothetical protein